MSATTSRQPAQPRADTSTPDTSTAQTSQRHQGPALPPQRGNDAGRPPTGAARPSRLQYGFKPQRASQRTSRHHPACGGSTAAVEAPTPAIVSAAASTPAPGHQPQGRRPGTPAHQAAGHLNTREREGRHGPGHQPPTASTGQALPPQRRTPRPAGHLNTGSPAAVEAPTRPHTRAPALWANWAGSAQGPGLVLPPQQGKRRPPTRASPPSWTPQRPGRFGRNSVGCSQPAPPLDTSRPGLAGEPCRTPQRRPLAGHEKSTKPAAMVRNLVRKNANLLKISVFCGGERTKTPIKLRNTAETGAPC